MNGSPAETAMRALVTVRAFELAAVDPLLSRLLDPSEHARAGNFTDESARRDFLAGRVIQRLNAAELLGVRPESLQAAYWCPDCGTEPVPSHGRPGYLADGAPAAISLSLSRSRGWALLAMAPFPGCGIGADVQHVESVGFVGFDGVALGAAERSRLQNVAPGGQDAWRAAAWARKEALAKQSGLGLRTDPACIDAFPDPASEVVVWDVDAAGLPAGFAAAVAISAGGVPATLPGRATG